MDEIYRGATGGPYLAIARRKRGTKLCRLVRRSGFPDGIQDCSRCGVQEGLSQNNGLVESLDGYPRGGKSIWWQGIARKERCSPVIGACLTVQNRKKLC